MNQNTSANAPKIFNKVKKKIAVNELLKQIDSNREKINSARLNGLLFQPGYSLMTLDFWA